jgi:hypothetical protein
MLHEEDVRRYVEQIGVPGDSSWVDGDGTWLPEREAFRSHGLAATTLRVWRRSKKPGLRTKRVRLRTFGNRSPLVWVYHEEDLKRIAAGETRPEPGVFRNELGDWLSARAAIDRYGFAHSTLRAWRKAGCWQLDGRKVRTIRVTLPVDKWHPRPSWAYFAEDLVIIAAKQGKRQEKHEDQEGNWITAGLAERSHGMDYSTLHWYRGHDCQHLGNRRIRAKRVDLPLGCKQGHRRVWMFHEEDVKRIVASLGKLPRPRGPENRFAPKGKNGEHPGAQIAMVQGKVNSQLVTADPAGNGKPPIAGTGEDSPAKESRSDLRRMVEEMPEAEAKSIVRKFNQNFGRWIGSGKKRRATVGAVYVIRSRLKKAKAGDEA